MAGWVRRLSKAHVTVSAGSLRRRDAKTGVSNFYANGQINAAAAVKAGGDLVGLNGYRTPTRKFTKKPTKTPNRRRAGG